MDGDRIAALLRTPSRSARAVSPGSGGGAAASPVALSAHKARRYVATPPSSYTAVASTAQIPHLLGTLSPENVATLFERIVARHHPELGAHLAPSPWHAKEVTITAAPALVAVEVTRESAVELRPPARRPSPSPSPMRPSQCLLDTKLLAAEVRARCQLEQSEHLSRQAVLRFEAGHRGLTSAK
jgi:hypothetical protein